MSQLEISGKDFKDEQLKNKRFKEIILFRFHLEISGNFVNDEHYIK